MNTTLSHLDKYSCLICAKYFLNYDDYINLMCVSSKFNDLVELYHFNPISVQSKTLFPRMETQYLYANYDEKLDGFFKYVVTYEVSYKECLNDISNNTIYKKISITKNDLNDHLASLQAFLDTGLQQITYSPKIWNLSSRCFYGIQLQSLNIPTTVQSIGDSCFCCCSRLSSITIPSHITDIGSNCFKWCRSLSNIEIPNCTEFSGLVPLWMSLLLVEKNIHCSNVEYTMDDATGRNNYYANAINEIEIPNKVNVIASDCFDQCFNLKTIVFPSTIQHINGGVFDYKVSYKSISMIKRTSFKGLVSYKVSELLKKHFVCCNNISLTKNDVTLGKLIPEKLTTFTIPSEIKSISSDCFVGKSDFVTIENTTNLTSLGSYSFGGCTSLTSYIASSKLKKIPRYCFNSCTNIQSVVLPNCITTFGELSFSNCCSLKTFQLPSSLLSLGMSCFYCCSNLTSINFPNHILRVPSRCFYGCCNLINVTLPKCLMTLDDYCFYGCISLQYITIPTTVKRIESYCFYDCMKLKQISTTACSIGRTAFYRCCDLEEVELLGNLGVIEENCFSGCTSLTKINISTVTSFKSKCFHQCDKLRGMVEAQPQIW
ncbi:hypothetical protein QTN25_001515 [Entamoeba marina]